ncbi:MAG: rRNA maturation RNase YbeY [Crocinitomicaceae bacterium]|nr:rRNA maturation RNase YbeY [Crocinitomicaceae bacterium]
MSLINVFYEDIEILDLDPEFFVSWLSKVCMREQAVLGEVNLIFCSDEYLLDVNKEFLKHDYYTDIVTFDYTTDNCVSGDLFISLDRVRENAEERSVNVVEERNRVVVHGVLHLLGYKDKSDMDKKIMRVKEDEGLMLVVPRET